jgi:dihydrofolate synthase/folylpolyglutamate synthase
MGSLGDPQHHLRAIHITGTNGKGSTATISAELLRAHGLNVGLYTSPHLTKVNERITINGHAITDDDLAAALYQVRQAAARISVYPTWFEVVTATALLYFAEHRVDAAVIAVGMLGLWDAPNVVDAPVAVITNVELDHTDIAGPTRELIAYEKAGIIGEGATLVLGEQDAMLLPIFEQRRPRQILLRGRDISIQNIDDGDSGGVADFITAWGRFDRIALRLAGGFQRSNALLALAGVESFLDARLDIAAVVDVLANVSLPGRFETAWHAPLVVLDCAHNEAAALQLRPLIDQTFLDAAPRVLLRSDHRPRPDALFVERRRRPLRPHRRHRASVCAGDSIPRHRLRGLTVQHPSNEGA